MKFLKLSLPVIMMLFSQFPVAQTIAVIPIPEKVIYNDGVFKIGALTQISTNEKDKYNLNYLSGKLSIIKGFGVKHNSGLSSNSIILSIDNQSNIPSEGYVLKVNNDKIEISASTKAGIFYGIQTLLQLLPPTIYSGNATGFEKWEVPALEITDSPRFSYRGMMLDVSRTFFDKETVLKYIDWMSYHKINKFHWHLSDDNGWRIEIKKYPKLTELGAWRGDNEVLPASFGSGSQRYGGYYTQKDIKQIVAYAAERNIEIIPEIDLPGHSKAVTASYPEVLCKSNDESESVQGEVSNVWCVSNEKNYKMLDNIIKEIASLFPSKTMHIGGDEVNRSSWENCKSCKDLMSEKGMKQTSELQNYFVRRLEKIVEKYGKQMAGWDEILEGGDLHPNTKVYAWRNVAKGIESITKGQPTILMPGAFCYLDMKQSPEERGHNWAGIVSAEKTYSLDPTGSTNLDNDKTKLILGVQGGLWTELLGWPARFIEYQTYPRLAALAEVGWSKQENREWNNFSLRLNKFHFDRLSNMGIAFRVEPPKAVYNDSSITVTTQYPWEVVRFTDDESAPVSHSSVYNGPIKTSNPLKYRFSTFYNSFTNSIPVKVSNVDYVYKTPEVEIETSLSLNQRSPITNITDYKFDTYLRSAAKAKAGDFVIYKFKEPVETSRITVETGIPNINFYWVTEGYVEYSYNGTDFIKGDDLFRGKATIIPNNKIKAVKINITAPNDANTLVLQDLRIE
jgi:hexosaminidase